jgi:hypothetical protein
MIRRKNMNNKQQENGARTGPLIFTVPAYGFVMALYLDWLNGPVRSGSFFAPKSNQAMPASSKAPAP